MENKTAIFTNFTSEDFKGYWNGKGKTFRAGQSVFMPEGFARHFAKHLVNRELLRTKPDGTLVYPNGDTMTSPKFPEQVPVFMELFDKAFKLDENEDEVLSDETDELDTAINTAQKQRDNVQVVEPPDDEDDTNQFEGKPAPLPVGGEPQN